MSAKLQLFALMCFLSFALAFCSAWGQDVEVQLDDLTRLDDEGLHLSIMSSRSNEELVIPELASREFKVLEVYSSSAEPDKMISILVLPAPEGEWLYIDFNNDEDLRNDGPPRLFARHSPEFAFDLGPLAKPRQVTTLRLHRRPPPGHRDSEAHAQFRESVVDSLGNLSSTFRSFYATVASAPGFTGEVGTFFFDDRLSLKRGKAALAGQEFDVGLFDYNGNGLYDDTTDVFLIDLNGNGRLNLDQAIEVFRLDDIFVAGDMRYRLSFVDPYGNGVRITPTEDVRTRHYIRASIDDQNRFDVASTTGTLDMSLWELEVETLSREPLRLETLRGRYILMTFWGEWCSPCLREIPSLVSVYGRIPRERLEIIGMLRTDNLDAAEEVIEDYEIAYPQVRVNKELEELFKIQAYSTNLLIHPDGDTFIQMNHITEAALLDLLK